MDSVVATAAAAAGLFAVTNVDDMVVLAVLNASSRATGQPKRWQIWAGQYAGVAVLVGVCLLAALGLTLVPERWVRVLGLAPLGRGVRKLVTAVRARGSGGGAPSPPVTGLAGVTGLTIANGGDNIAAHIPVSRAIGAGRIAVTIAVFAAGVAVWCLAGSWLVSHRTSTEAAGRYGQCIIRPRTSPSASGSSSGTAPCDRCPAGQAAVHASLRSHSSRVSSGVAAGLAARSRHSS
jgi:cadmium resistance protein CadD (predicted permease)